MRNVVVLFALLLLAVLPAAAQQRSFITVDVPFDFYLGDRAMASGTYNIMINASRTYGILQRVDTKAPGGIFLGIPKSTDKTPADTSTVVFLKYDNDHVFLKAMNHQAGYGYQLPTSRTEREHVHSTFTPLQQTSAQPERVVLYARNR